ncbi:hypothetical protein [Reichenbachiella sp.]|uniref:hypothetical protein n=1 Tax=Reichenbachiella sp. TaxID=2184521 RepID=UPI003BAFD9C0
MIPEKAWDLIPEQINAADWALRIADRTELTGNSRKAYLQATKLISEFLDYFEERNYLSTSFLERFRILDLSAGFIPNYYKRSDVRRGNRNLDFEEYNDYAFGVIIGVDARLIDPDWPYGEFGGNGIFPFIIEPRDISYEVPPNITGPSMAVSSCYVKPKPGKSFYYHPTWSSGILTVRHAFKPSYSPGTIVSLAGGNNVQVAEIDKYSSTIDAAILDCGTLPSGISTIPVVAGLAPGDSVNVRTSSSSFSANVLRIFEHPSSYSSLFGHRVFIDTTGVAGDSGSFVTRTNNSQKEAVGIYMGRTGTSPDEGIIQSMRQITNAFEIEIFD